MVGRYIFYFSSPSEFCGHNNLQSMSACRPYHETGSCVPETQLGYYHCRTFYRIPGLAGIKNDVSASCSKRGEKKTVVHCNKGGHSGCHHAVCQRNVINDTTLQVHLEFNSHASIANTISEQVRKFKD